MADSEGTPTSLQFSSCLCIAGFKHCCHDIAENYVALFGSGHFVDRLKESLIGMESSLVFDSVDAETMDAFKREGA